MKSVAVFEVQLGEEILSNFKFIYVYLNHPLNKDVRAIRESQYVPSRKVKEAEERKKRREEENRSLPLNGGWRFGRNIIAHSIDSSAFIDYSVRDFAKQDVVHMIPIGSHEVSGGNTPNSTCLR